MHNGYVTVDGEKMSKSLGNFHTVHDLLDRAPGEAIRLSLLTAQYRQPLDFSLEGLDRAKAALDRLYTALAGASDVAASDDPGTAEPVLEALSDDLNTPKALAEMHALTGTLNRSDSADERARAKAGLLFAGGLMGLLENDPKSWRHRSIPLDVKYSGVMRGQFTASLTVSRVEKIEALVAERSRARAAKDFAEADRIRDELMEIHNVVVEDRPDGSSEWRRA